MFNVARYIEWFRSWTSKLQQEALSSQLFKDPECWSGRDLNLKVILVIYSTLSAYQVLNRTEWIKIKKKFLTIPCN